jgi:hypothetical protein
MKKTILSVIVLTVLITSCKKEESTPGSCTVSSTSLTGTYKPTGLKYKASSSAPEQDFFAMLESCEKDDIIKLNSNGTMDYQDVNSVCTPSGSYSSTWSFSGTTFTMDGTPGTIQSFNCKTLVIKAVDQLVPGDITIATFEKQ